ncbi:MAG: tRNA (N(6)-L-threonylcarbamoyladenosine(37)-C(2))-methylthiotransferase MtaB [Anaerolineaceae bacterium]|jgi:threonylcarbamoyladenosine tRNA methylthiotransferase MtaB|nr:tRNA (N(6)-L-threonylcarbamoyladenosine(37)-C(2))-methylthiotransferase MtaB [Anaerolineaceae bacterium]
MKIYLDMIGCRLNQSEIERMAAQFRVAGHEIVASAEMADVVVVNTCAVTGHAVADSRKKIRRALQDGTKPVIATGCWATLAPADTAALADAVRVVSNEEKDQLVADFLNLPVEDFATGMIARSPLPGAHSRTRAFIKVQDGCDNTCTFCVTRLARGASRSVPVEEVLADIRAAQAGGTQEVVLTGVNIQAWGQDAGDGLHLGDLLAAVLAETDVPRVRLSSLEPWELKEGFFNIWQDERMCQHLHLPLQSGSAGTLKRMVRKTTPGDFRRLVEGVRAHCPQMAVTTDIITGFPGEDQAEFAETLAFVREMQFAGGHVFTFSARPGTAAARMKGQVPVHVRKERNAVLRGVLKESAQRYRQQFLGQVVSVLWESAQEQDGGWLMTGLTGEYLRVEAVSPVKVWNVVQNVRLVKDGERWMRGEIVGE